MINKFKQAINKYINSWSKNREHGVYSFLLIAITIILFRTFLRLAYSPSNAQAIETIIGHVIIVLMIILLSIILSTILVMIILYLVENRDKD